MSKYHTLPVRFTPGERQALLDLIGDELLMRNRPPTPNRALYAAFGKLSEGDNMTLAECRAAFGTRWYISPTGRKLKSRALDETPITPRRYAEAEATAITHRWFKPTTGTREPTDADVEDAAENHEIEADNRGSSLRDLTPF